MTKCKSIILSMIMFTVITGSMFVYNVPSVIADINIKPEQITIFEQTPIYDDYRNPVKPAGILAGPQTLTIKGFDLDWEVRHEERFMPGWYLVETWLGDKWVRATDRMVDGALIKEERVVTSAFTVDLYDRPDYTYPIIGKVAPQKLYVTASLLSPELYFVNASTFATSDGGYHWYRIKTWLGEKWIVNPALLEDVVEEPVSYMMKLAGEEMVYPKPFVVEKTGERIESQAVNVIAEWKIGFGPSEQTWLKLELPQGERWVIPQHQMLKNYKKVNEQLQLLTATRYFEELVIRPDVNDWLEAGTYRAFEVSGEWIHIETPHGEQWVNPTRALLERPLGIVSTEEIITLTKDTTTYWSPMTGEVAHNKGYYAPQQVKAYEKWTSEAGVIWYHIHGYSVDEWVVAP